MSKYVSFSTTVHRRKRYGFVRFCIDLLLTSLTGGLWLLWLLFKFLRRGHI